MKGKILKSTGLWYQVLLEDHTVLACRLKGKIRLSDIQTTNPVAVGDWVEIDAYRDDEGNGIIESVLPRVNYIMRKSTNLSKQAQILAANVDRVYLVVTLHSPPTHLAFIDRFLVAAESFRIPVTLLWNKVDLYSKIEIQEVKKKATVYERLGYPNHLLTATDESTVEFLRSETAGLQVMFGGHSGVGKSTIINALAPELNLRTGAISNAHQSGQHTTTFAEMHPLTNGGYLIDTPGIRAFGFSDIIKEELAHYFPEMRQLLNDCKFHNCLHLKEPHCAVKKAVHRGDIEESRYNNYVGMMETDENETFRKNIYG